MRPASRRSVVVLAIVLAGCGSQATSPSPPPAPTPASTAAPATSAVAPTATTTTPTPSPTPASSAWAEPAFLPKAGRILFTVEREGQATRLGYVDQAGLHEIPIGNDATFANAIWAPGDTIIFDSERVGGVRHIFRMGIDGGNVVQLTSGSTAQDSAAVSPDGKTMAFGDVDPAQGRDIGIHLANIDGSHVRDLTPGGGPGVDGEDDAVFSPDGTWIAFQRVVDPNVPTGGLFLIHPDGTGLRRLTDDATGAGYARWSPDGKRILYSDATSRLWVVDVASRKATQLSDPADPGLFNDANWSPDGKQIVYRHFTPGSPASIELVIASADGTEPKTLWVAPLDHGAFRPDWSA